MRVYLNKRIMLEVVNNDTLESLVLSVERYINLPYTDVVEVVKELRKSLKDVVTAVDNGVDKLYASVLEVVKHIKGTS